MTAKLQGIKVRVRSKLKALRKIASSLKGLTAFLMFGSYARGGETPLSDVDFAFLPKPGLKPEAEDKLDRELYREISKILKTDDITLVNLRESPVMLAFDILRGKVLFCRDKANLKSYQEHVLTLYPEIKKSRDEILEVYRAKLREYENRRKKGFKSN